MLKALGIGFEQDLLDKMQDGGYLAGLIQNKTHSQFIAECERHQSQSRAIHLAIVRSTPPIRKFLNRWNSMGTLVSCGHCKATMWLDERIDS